MADRSLYHEILVQQGIEYGLFDRTLHLVEQSPGLPALTLQGEALQQRWHIGEMFEEFAGLENDLVQVAQGSRQPFSVEKVRRQLKSGRQGYFTYSVSRYADGLLLTVTDVSADAEQMQQLVQQRNELRLVSRQLSVLRDQLDDLVRRFVPEDVAEQMVSSAKHGRHRNATVIHADLKGFGSLAGSLDEDRLFDLLDSMLAHAVRHITSAGGVLDHYVGNAIVGIFNATEEDPNHALDAVSVACQITNAFNESGYFHLSIGISTGATIVGRIGKGKEAKYTAVGEACTLASLLQSEAPADKVHITSSTLALVKNQVRVRAASRLAPKGGESSIEVFEIEELLAE